MSKQERAPELQCLAVGGVKEEEEEGEEEEKKSVWRPTVPPPGTVGKNMLIAAQAGGQTGLGVWCFGGLGPVHSVSVCHSCQNKGASGPRSSSYLYFRPEHTRESCQSFATAVSLINNITPVNS